ncbi:MAG: hypothetical protein GY790_02380 [Bacteroidetes bacterium]|nr:hypothetical protein [Bacteroidota bacterium]
MSAGLNMLKYFIQYKFSILLAGFIVLLSLIPSSTMPESRLFDISFLDKIVHVGMYGTFGLVALLERRCQQKCFSKELFLLFLIFTLSTLMEVLQATVVATRSAEWLDLVANLTGLVGAYTVYTIYRKIRA